MARPKPNIARVQISLKVKPAFLKMIDAARGEISRADYLEGLVLMSAYRQIEAASAPPARARARPPAD